MSVIVQTSDATLKRIIKPLKGQVWTKCSFCGKTSHSEEVGKILDIHVEQMLNIYTVEVM